MPVARIRDQAEAERLCVELGGPLWVTGDRRDVVETGRGGIHTDH